MLTLSIQTRRSLITGDELPTMAHPINWLSIGLQQLTSFFRKRPSLAVPKQMFIPYQLAICTQQGFLVPLLKRKRFHYRAVDWPVLKTTLVGILLLSWVVFFTFKEQLNCNNDSGNRITALNRLHKKIATLGCQIKSTAKTMLNQYNNYFIIQATDV